MESTTIRHKITGDIWAVVCDNGTNPTDYFNSVEDATKFAKMMGYRNYVVKKCASYQDCEEFLVYALSNSISDAISNIVDVRYDASPAFDEMADDLRLLLQRMMRQHVADQEWQHSHDGFADFAKRVRALGGK